MCWHRTKAKDRNGFEEPSTKWYGGSTAKALPSGQHFHSPATLLPHRAHRYLPRAAHLQKEIDVRHSAPTLLLSGSLPMLHRKDAAVLRADYCAPATATCKSVGAHSAVLQDTRLLSAAD